MKYNILKDDFGGWNIWGIFTASFDNTKCIDNPSKGAEAIPLSFVSVPITVEQALPVIDHIY